METSHFEFVQFADDTSQAEQLLNAAFHAHLKECDTEWEDDLTPTEYYGMRTIPVLNHATYRDGERMRG